MVKRKRDANKIIVVGLPEGTDNEALEAMFADIGKVYAAHVVGLDDTTGISKGYGFVTFADAESCSLSIEKMHKTMIEGRTINVRMVEEREPNETKGRDSNKVIIAGLTQTITDEKLQLMCEEFGLVLKAVVVRNPAGKSKGFGFVTFTNKSCQQACILKLDKRKLGGGRILNVRAVDNRQPGDEATGVEAESPINKKTTFEDTDDGKEGICIRFQMNKCHRGKGCRWKHVKIPNFQKSSKQELVEKSKEKEAKKTESEKSIEKTIEKVEKKTIGKKINGQMIIIDENDTEDEDDDKEEEEEGDAPIEAPKTSSVGVTVFDDDDEDEEDEEDGKQIQQKESFVSFDDDDEDEGDEEDGKQIQQKESFVSFDDDDEEDGASFMQLNTLGKQKQNNEFESDLFDDDEEEDAVGHEKGNVESASSFRDETTKSMALMDSILGTPSKKNVSKAKSSKKSKTFKK